jgi:HK97 family phage major capsid protein
MRSTDDILADMSTLLDGAAGRDLTDDEINAWETLDTELKAAQLAEARARATDTGSGSGDGSEPVPANEPAPATASAAARRQASASIRAQHKAYNTIVVPAGRPSNSPRPQDSLEKAFNHYLRTGKPNSDLIAPQNAQGTDTGPAGGYLVPDGFRDKLVDRMKAFGGLATVVEELTTTTGENLLWPTIDDTANTGEVVDEGGTFSGGADLVFGEGNIGAYQYMAGGAGGVPLRLSLRLVRDARVDIEGLVSGKLGMRMARIQATHWVTGTGVKQPQGITTGKTGIEIAANTAVTYADLVHFVHQVDPAYRDNARWAFNDASLEVIRTIEDDNGRPILKGSTEGAATGAGGETLLGYPVTIDQAFANLNKSSNTVNWGVFGDLEAAYLLRRVEEVAIVVNPWTRAQYGQIEYSAIAWADGIVQDTNAFIALTGQA